MPWTVWRCIGLFNARHLTILLGTSLHESGLLCMDSSSVTSSSSSTNKVASNVLLNMPLSAVPHTVLDWMYKTSSSLSLQSTHEGRSSVMSPIIDNGSGMRLVGTRDSRVRITKKRPNAENTYLRLGVARRSSCAVFLRTQQPSLARGVTKKQVK